MTILGIVLLAIAILFSAFVVLMALCLCKVSGTHAEDDDLAWELLKNQEERKDK